MKPISREVYDALQHDPFYKRASEKMVKKGYWKIVEDDQS